MPQGEYGKGGSVRGIQSWKGRERRRGGVYSIKVGSPLEYGNPWDIHIQSKGKKSLFRQVFTEKILEPFWCFSSIFALNIRLGLAANGSPSPLSAPFEEKGKG